MGPTLEPNPSRPRTANRGDRSVADVMLPAATDRARAWSTVILALAVVVAGLSTFGPPPVNGISVAAVVLAVVALIVRRIEAER